MSALTSHSTGRKFRYAPFAPVSFVVRHAAMNIGIGGAIILWALMLWPILVTVGYFLMLRPQLSNVPATGFACIIVGYAAMLGMMMLIDLFERWVVKAELLAIVLPWIVPMVTTHTIAIIASKKSKALN